MKAETLKHALQKRAQSLGFCVMRVTEADLPAEDGEGLRDYLANSYHGDMDWMLESVDRRQHPRALWPEARSAILLGMSYAPEDNPLNALTLKDRGLISAYARSRDYHDEIKGKLKQCAALLAADGHAVKVFVDTAPLMEKPLARQAGLGWQGKHTVIVSRQHGNWLLLGVILTTALLPHDRAETDHCGSCRRCLDICPTRAFPAPYQLDARRCITYLTVEHKGSIPTEFRTAIGNRIFGCDDCLAVCPWNKFAQMGQTWQRTSRADLAHLALEDLLQLDEADFRIEFATTPIKRTGYRRFMRNVLIAAGNAAQKNLRQWVEPYLIHADSLLRGTAVWAFSRLASQQEIQDAYQKICHVEQDEEVLTEWKQALSGLAVPIDEYRIL